MALSGIGGSLVRERRRYFLNFCTNARRKSKHMHWLFVNGGIATIFDQLCDLRGGVTWSNRRT